MALSTALIAISLLCTYCLVDGSKPVSTVLRSYWPQTSIILEASEFVSEYDQRAFWSFVESTLDLDKSTLNDKELYEAVLDRSEPLLSPTVYSLFILSLSLHTHSPIVEMFNQVALERLAVLGSVSCSSFIEIRGSLHCSIEDALSALDSSSNSETTAIYEFDHIHPRSVEGAPTAVLYTELGREGFSSLHTTMVTLAKEGRIRYVLRHYQSERGDVRVVLSGWGVELAIKNSEYKAVDDSKVKEDDSRVVEQADEGGEDVEGFIFSTLRSRHPHLKENLEEFQTHLRHATRELPELKLWQLQELGLQAAQRVMSSSPQLALKLLKDIAQSVPMAAKSLYRLPVDKELRREVAANQKVLGSMGIGPGSSVLLLNGIIIQNENTDIFQLIEMLMSEARLLEGLSGLSIGPSDHAALAKLPVHAADSNSFTVDIRNESIIFINDLENDRHYRAWPKSLREFMQPAYPGTLRQVARNVFNIVFMIDPVTPDGKEMVEYIKLFLDHNVPARLGVLLLPSNDEGVSLSRGFAQLVKDKSPRDAFKWFNKVLSIGNLTVESVRTHFEEKYKKEIQEDDTLILKSREFFSSKGFDEAPQVLVNGVQLDVTEDLETGIVGTIQKQMYSIQQAIYTNKLNDQMNVYDYLLNKSNVLERLNKHVVTKGKQLDLSGRALAERDGVLSDRELSTLTASKVHYYSNAQGEFLTKELSVWVVGDYSTAQTRQAALEALQFADSDDRVRVGLIPSSSSSHASLIEANLRSGGDWSVVRQILSTETPKDGQRGLRFETVAAGNDVIRDHVTFVSQTMGVSPQSTTIIANGRVVGPLGPNDSFTKADYQLLASVESSQYTQSLVELVNDLTIEGLDADNDTSSFRSELHMKLASLLLSQPKRRRLADLPTLKTEHSVLQLPAPEGGVAMKVVAIIDPLSSEAQKLAPLLQVLQVALPLDITLVLNPVPKLTELPVKSFYRYVLEPELSFTLDGAAVTPMAVFSDLPQTSLLTLHLDVPHSWLVEAVWSPHDLDNIHLDGVVGGGVQADFQLKNILVEGQCFDERSSQPVPGLEYVLGTRSAPAKFDTIVMANLGYFQLKAGPGVWVLQLRDGRSSQIYAIQSHIGGDDQQESSIGITVKDFKGAGVVVYVAKRPDMKSAQLLSGDKEANTGKEEEKNLWDSLSSFMGGGDEPKEEEKRVTVGTDETINIFSLASGHLYERFLRIMMLSVLKQTHNPVKFWFLKNFLSPTFKDFIPHMAQHYGFEYELVEYKWPRWLHAQTQKQRIIWGYKILFLDVLFPLSVKKIIFVDADQIVRTDLRELLEIDLHGAPYAYTPFCDSRPDMAGFRFWDSGYWKNHLGNRRYHISALYVIDLLRFRQLAAGDRLRGQYQALSQDPNSLANLDQDLPNNMIHAVPIHSLPQEWLWCETWCSLESKSAAKTIDLCNNPLTKEPKLNAAVRIVPEWTSYDNEIKELMQADNSTPQDSPKHTHTEL